MSFIYLFSVELIAFLYRNDSNVKSHYRKHSLTWHSRKRSKTKQSNGWTQLENRNRNCSTWVSFKTIVSIWCLVLYTHDWIRIKTLHENRTFSRNGLNWKHILKRRHHSSFYTSAGVGVIRYCFQNIILPKMFDVISILHSEFNSVEIDIRIFAWQNLCPFFWLIWKGVFKFQINYFQLQV